MTYLDAAYQILQQAGSCATKPSPRALAQQLISPQGLTPEATMASRLYTEALQEGSRFTRVDKGTFGLVDWRPAAEVNAAVQVKRWKGNVQATTRSPAAQSSCNAGRG